MAGPEATEERLAREWLKNTWVIRKVKFLDANGAPDRLFLHKTLPLHFFAEFKRPDDKGELSAQQINRIAELRAAGVRVEIFTSAEQTINRCKDLVDLYQASGRTLR